MCVGGHHNDINMIEITGDVFLHARKMRRLAENIYETTDVDFYLNAEDIRFDNDEGSLGLAHKEIVRSQRSQTVKSTKRFELVKAEIQTLQHRCWHPPSANNK